MGRTMVLRRLRGLSLSVLFVGLAVAAAGCGGGGGSTGPDGSQTQTFPAAAAGGACQLLDYGVIMESTGVRFDTAGASQNAETYTCAVTQAGVTYPDLT